MAIPWVEKYRPRTLRDIVGNNQAIAQMKKWAMDWDQGKPQKPIILVGKPGCGKTSAARALANDMKWGVIELNASDVRNEKNIKRIAMVGAVNETFTDDGKFISSKFGGRKLIIFDEADNLYEGKDDRGGKKAIVETIRVAKQPIILIGNDYYGILSGVWGKKLKSMCAVVKFRALTSAQIIKVLNRICRGEEIVCEKEALRVIASRCGGDLRAAINDLQAVAEGKKVLRVEEVKAVGYRDVKNQIYKTVLKVLHTVELNEARRYITNTDETPDYILLWVEENMPLEYTKTDEMVRAYEYLSRADVYLGRVVRRQQYSLWSYAIDMLSAVSVAKEEEYKKHPRYAFPSWLRVMSTSKARRDTRDSIGMKLGVIYHASSQRVKEDILPYFRVLYEKNRELRALYTYLLHLEDKEISFLTDLDVEEILKDAEKIEEKIEKKGEGGSA